MQVLLFNSAEPLREGMHLLAYLVEHTECCTLPLVKYIFLCGTSACGLGGSDLQKYFILGSKTERNINYMQANAMTWCNHMHHHPPASARAGSLYATAARYRVAEPAIVFGQAACRLAPLGATGTTTAFKALCIAWLPRLAGGCGASTKPTLPRARPFSSSCRVAGVVARAPRDVLRRTEGKDRLACQRPGAGWVSLTEAPSGVSRAIRALGTRSVGTMLPYASCMYACTRVQNGEGRGMSEGLTWASRMDADMWQCTQGEGKNIKSQWMHEPMGDASIMIVIGFLHGRMCRQARGGACIDAGYGCNTLKQTVDGMQGWGANLKGEVQPPGRSCRNDDAGGCIQPNGLFGAAGHNRADRWGACRQSSSSSLALTLSFPQLSLDMEACWRSRMHEVHTKVTPGIHQELIWAQAHVTKSTAAQSTCVSC